MAVDYNSIDYERCAELLASVFIKAGIDYMGEYSITDALGNVAKFEPELYNIARSVVRKRVQARPFLERVVAASRDRRLGCFSGFGAGKERGGIFYYKGVEDGAPSEFLLHAVAICYDLSMTTITNPSLVKTRTNKSLGHVIRELLDYYKRPDALERALAECKDVQQPEDEPQEELSLRMVPGYPISNWVRRDSPSFQKEFERFEAEVEYEPFDDHVRELRMLTRHDGTDARAWVGQFAHDWHNGATPLKEDESRAWWRSTNLSDAYGREIFATFHRSEDGQRWVLEKICSADDIREELGIRSSRRRQVNFFDYSYLRYYLYRARAVIATINEGELLRRVADRTAQGKLVSETDLVGLRAMVGIDTTRTNATISRYVEYCNEFMQYVSERHLESEVGDLREQTIEELFERINNLLASDEDPGSEWIGALSDVITGSRDRFLMGMGFLPELGAQPLIKFPMPMFETDLEALNDAAEHFDATRDWLVDTSVFYCDLVKTLASAESYDSCGEGLREIEARYGGNLRPYFVTLCEAFKNTPLSCERLVQLMERCQAAESTSDDDEPAQAPLAQTALTVPTLDEAIQGLEEMDEDEGAEVEEPVTELVEEVPAEDDATKAGPAGGLVAEVAEVSRDISAFFAEDDDEEDEETVPDVSAPSNRTSQRPQRDEMPVLSISSYADLIKGNERYYDRGIDRGVAADMPRLLELRAALSSESIEEAPDGESLLYDPESRSMDGFLAFVESALEDEVRPTKANRLFWAFEEPDEDEFTSDEYTRYLLARLICERLHATEESRHHDDLSYWVEQLLSWIEEHPELSGTREVLTLAESALYLATSSFDSQSFANLPRVSELLGKDASALSDLERFVDASRQDCVDYLSRDALRREIYRLGGADELDEITEFAQAIGPDSLAIPFRGARFLWSALFSSECDERFVRVRDMVDAMAGRRADYQRLWAFEDDGELEGFLDASFSWAKFLDKGNVHIGKVRKIEAYARERLLSVLNSINRHFERFCELRSLGSENAHSDAIKEIASVLASARDTLLARAEQRGDDPICKIVSRLLAAYPSETLPWGKDSSLAIEELAPSRPEVELAIVEFQHHRVHGPAGQVAPVDYLPGDEDLQMLSQRILDAYVLNVIGSTEQATLRSVVAGVLGAIRHFQDAEDDSLGARMVLWCYECVSRRVDDAFKATLARFEEAITSELGDPTGSLDDSRRQSLQKTLDKVRAQDAPEAVLSQRDFLFDANVSLPEPLALQADDVLYAIGDDGCGVYTEIRADLEKNWGGSAGTGLSSSAKRGFSPSCRIAALSGLGIDALGDSDHVEIAKVSRCLEECGRIIHESPIPVNGASKDFGIDSVKAAMRSFGAQAERLFECVGFQNPVVRADDEGVSTWRFTLDFLANPNATTTDGSLVCPLMQLISLPGDANGTNARLYLEVYTNYNELRKGILRRDLVSRGRRIALYLSPKSRKMEERLLKRIDRVKLAKMVFSQGVADDPSGTGFLILDWVMLAYLLHWDEGNDRLGAFFRCTSQTTYLHPYGDKGTSTADREKLGPSGRSAPYDLPPLFYGHRATISRIRSFDENRAFMVYGARRMGKTSVLREAQSIVAARSLAENAKDVCGFRDMRGHAVGSVSELWTDYVGPAVEDAARGLIPGLAEAIQSHSEAQVKDAMRGFMSEGGRILILLDEADDLIRHDGSIARQGPHGVKVNAVIDSLYDFVNVSSNRFKFVLCGLHQTMRKSGADKNSVKGHLGEPQVIAPLWEFEGYNEAYRLVLEPMKSLGVRLSHESALRIISRTGYYPNLINYVCQQILINLRSSASAWKGPFEAVPDRVVTEAFARYDTKLRSNFDDTIDLDPAYGTIVYAIAVHCSRNGWGPIGVRDINPVIVEACKRIGVENVIAEEVDTYLSELVSLRILRKDERVYSFRDREIEENLKEFGEDIALGRLCAAVKRLAQSPDEFHPELVRSTTAGEDWSVAPLSSLNPLQVTTVTKAFDTHGLCVVRGSEDTGLDLLLNEIDSRPGVLDPRLDEWGVVELERVEEELPLSDSEEGTLYVVTGDWDETDVERATGLAGQSERFVFVAGPERSWELEGYLGGPTAPPLVTLVPWERVNVVLWLNRCLGDDAEEVASAFIRKTSGMPRLARHFASLLDVGAPVEAWLSEISNLGGPQMVSEGVRAQLDAHPEAKGLAERFATEVLRDGDGVFLSVGEWLEMLDIELDEEAAAQTVAWLVGMGLLRTETGDASGPIDLDSQVCPRTWAAFALCANGGEA